MTGRKLTAEQQIRHDELRHRWEIALGKCRRRRRIRIAMASRARLGFAVPRGRGR